MRPYETDPKAIYAQSFATVRAEARLERFAPAMHPLITRLIHSCGMVEVADRLVFSADATAAGRAALQAGAPVLCDCEMVGAGIGVTLIPDMAVTIETRSASVSAGRFTRRPIFLWG